MALSKWKGVRREEERRGDSNSVCRDALLCVVCVGVCVGAVCVSVYVLCEVLHTNT